MQQAARPRTGTGTDKFDFVSTKTARNAGGISFSAYSGIDA